MATIQPDGTILMNDGRVIYADDEIRVEDLCELANLLCPQAPFLGFTGAAGATGGGFVGGGRGGRGPQGPKGDPGSGGGAQGPQGVAGADGPQGFQGNLGPQGAQGPEGGAGVNCPTAHYRYEGSPSTVAPAGTRTITKTITPECDFVTIISQAWVAITTETQYYDVAMTVSVNGVDLHTPASSQKQSRFALQGRSASDDDPVIFSEDSAVTLHFAAVAAVTPNIANTIVSTVTNNGDDDVSVRHMNLQLIEVDAVQFDIIA